MSKKFYPVLKRIMDFAVAFISLLILVPLFMIIAVAIIFDSKGGIFYVQDRLGLNMMNFRLVKFRTMRLNSDKLGHITIGVKDPRVTRVGYFLRKYKLDELPQLINIVRGEMSFVGPRPEVEKYVRIYRNDYQVILSVRPGLTDYASIVFAEENRIISGQGNPEEFYINNIMPKKIRLNQLYIKRQSFATDTYIIIKTFKKVFFR